MIVTKKYNNFSKETLSKIPKLEPGQVAEYRLLDIQPDKENPGTYKLPEMRGVQKSIQVFENGKPIGLAHVTDIENVYTDSGMYEREVISNVWFRRARAGRIILSGDNARDVLLHEFLFLSPERKGSPFATDKIAPVYEFIDHEADARKAKEERSKRMEALRAAIGMSDEDLTKYAFLFGAKPTADLDVQRNAVEMYAEQNPEKFLQIAGDKASFEIQFAFKKAAQEGLINISPTGEVSWAESGKVIAKLSTTISEKQPQEFADWAGEHGDNKDLADMIVRAVNGKKTKKTK